MLVRATARLSRASKFLQVFGQSSRQLTLSRPSMKMIQFMLSDIGEGTKEVVVKEWYVVEGQMVEEFDELVEVQSDKATVPITSRYAGKILKLHYDVEDMAQVGQPLVDIELAGTDKNEEVDNYVDQIEIETTAGRSESVIKNVEEVAKSRVGGKVKIAPALRKIARANDIELSSIVATGKGGKITKEDIETAITARDAPEAPIVQKTIVTQAAPQVVAAPVAVKALPTRSSVVSAAGKTEKIGPIGKAMVKSMNQALKIPHFGYNEEYDFTNLVEIRRQLKPVAAEYNIKLSYMPFIIKAVSMALSEYPILNSSISKDETEVTYHSDHNIGVATDTPHGLLVPNIKQCQNLSVLEIAQELNRLVVSGAANKLSPKDITGGTFSLSNIGSIGGTYAKPVIMAPQVAIGAIGRIQRLPRFGENNEIIEKHLINISWTADHRLVEGAVMARFSNRLKHYLEQPAGMVLHLR